MDINKLSDDEKTALMKEYVALKTKNALYKKAVSDMNKKIKELDPLMLGIVKEITEKSGNTTVELAKSGASMAVKVSRRQEPSNKDDVINTIIGTVADKKKAEELINKLYNRPKTETEILSFTLTKEAKETIETQAREL